MIYLKPGWSQGSKKIASEQNCPPALILTLILNQNVTLTGGNFSNTDRRVYNIRERIWEKKNKKKNSCIIDYNRTLLCIFQVRYSLLLTCYFHDLWSFINQIHNCGIDWNKDQWSVKTGGNLKKPVRKVSIILKDWWKWTRNERKTFTSKIVNSNDIKSFTINIK